MVPARFGLSRHVSPQIVTGLDVDTSPVGRDSRGVPAHRRVAAPDDRPSARPVA